MELIDMFALTLIAGGACGLLVGLVAGYEIGRRSRPKWPRYDRDLPPLPEIKGEAERYFINAARRIG